MKNLDQKTKDLISAIKETSEYQNYEKASLEYKNDNEAQKLLDDFRKSQQNLAIFQDGNFSSEELEKERENYNNLSNAVRSNETINKWIKSKTEAQSLLSTLANIIGQDLDLVFAPQKKSSCCG